MPGTHDALLRRLRLRAEELNFTAASDPSLGELLAFLAASKPGGNLLELGTGVGIGTACLLRGMTSSAHLTTIDDDWQLSRAAQNELPDSRVTWLVRDGGQWLTETTETFDLVFADTWPGKFTHLEEALGLVRAGGYYLVDDLDPQVHWPDHHREAVEQLVATLKTMPGWVTLGLPGAGGLLLCARK